MLGVLVQVVVEFPGFVADPQVVVLLAGEVVEDHEVGEQDLIHPPDGLEAVQVVLGRLGLDVPGLAGQVRAGRVDALTARLQHPGDRMLGEPVDLQAGMQLAQLAGDRDVALGVAQADRRGDVERALAARPAARPARAWARGDGEVAQQQVDLDRVAHVRAVARALEQYEITAGRLGERDPAAGPGDRVGRALNHQHRAANPAAQLARGRLVQAVTDLVAMSVSAVVSRPQPTQSSVGLVECGSVNIWEKKNSRKPR